MGKKDRGSLANPSYRNADFKPPKVAEKGTAENTNKAKELVIKGKPVTQVR